MGRQSPDIKAGLYVVATPIGTATDLSLRALDLISNADVLVAEDKRCLLKLMNIHNVKLAGRSLLIYNDHSGVAQRSKILSFLKEERSIVLVSDAGTPLIADPGYRLVSEAIFNGYFVSVVPGASAVLTALAISGLPSDKFFFGGFIPPREKAKQAFFLKYLNLPSTLIFFESAIRLNKTLTSLKKVCELERKVVVCRELTKKYEDIQRGTLQTVSEYFASFQKVKGEIVILLGSSTRQVNNDTELIDFLAHAMQYMTLKDAVDFVAKRLNQPKQIVYKKALTIKNEI